MCIFGASLLHAWKYNKSDNSDIKIVINPFANLTQDKQSLLQLRVEINVTSAVSN